MVIRFHYVCVSPTDYALCAKNKEIGYTCTHILCFLVILDFYDVFFIFQKLTALH